MSYQDKELELQLLLVYIYVFSDILGPPALQEDTGADGHVPGDASSATDS